MANKFFAWTGKSQKLLGYDGENPPPDPLEVIINGKSGSLYFDRVGGSFPYAEYGGDFYSILIEDKDGQTISAEQNLKFLVDVSDSTISLEYRGGSGVDIVKAGKVSALIDGEGGNDDLTGGRDGDSLHGGRGDDRVDGGGGDDVVSGDDGNDKVAGGGSSDQVYGNAGDDKLDGGTGSDDVEGGNGHDKILGDAGRDDLSGGAGDDRISGGKDDDTLAGGSGDDQLRGDDDDDELTDLSGDNALFGGKGDDSLTGGFDFDELNGGAGEDVIFARFGGDDVMTGGSGADEFMFDRTAADSRITDFEIGADVINLFGVPGLRFGELKFRDRPDGVVIKYEIASDDTVGSIFLDDVEADQLTEDSFLMR